MKKKNRIEQNRMEQIESSFPLFYSNLLSIPTIIQNTLSTSYQSSFSLIISSIHFHSIFPSEISTFSKAIIHSFIHSRSRFTISHSHIIHSESRNQGSVISIYLYIIQVIMYAYWLDINYHMLFTSLISDWIYSLVLTCLMILEW